MTKKSTYLVSVWYDGTWEHSRINNVDSAIYLYELWGNIGLTRIIQRFVNA